MVFRSVLEFALSNSLISIFLGLSMAQEPSAWVSMLIFILCLLVPHLPGKGFYAFCFLFIGLFICCSHNECIFNPEIIWLREEMSVKTFLLYCGRHVSLVEGHIFWQLSRYHFIKYVFIQVYCLLAVRREQKVTHGLSWNFMKAVDWAGIWSCNGLRFKLMGLSPARSVTQNGYATRFII